MEWKAEGTAGKKPEYRKQMKGCENSKKAGVKKINGNLREQQTKSRSTENKWKAVRTAGKIVKEQVKTLRYLFKGGFQK